MEPNTQKGCLIGCLVSAGILVASTVLVVFAIALVVRGCAEMGADAMEEAVNTPQDANQFKKVWLSGDGEDAAHILKIRLHGVISSTVEHGIFETIDDTSAPTADSRKRTSAL